MTLNELQTYYSNIEGCHGNCNCCDHYYLCDYITEILTDPEAEENKEEIKELTEEDLDRL